MSHFRVLKEFEYRGARGVRTAKAGELVHIATKIEADRLFADGIITDVRLRPSAAAQTVDPAARLAITKRVGFFVLTSAHYSGGRVHLFQMAWCLARSGAEVFIVTDHQPVWRNDYPKCERLHVLIEPGDIVPSDLDVVVTDGKRGFGAKALSYVLQHPGTKLVCMNFESQNWLEELVPEKAPLVDIDRGAFVRADLLIANSSESMKYLRAWLQDNKRPGKVVPPVVNTEALAQSGGAPVVLPKRPFAVWCGRRERYKCADLAVEAVRSVPAPFDLIAVGDPGELLPDEPNHSFRLLKNRPDAEKFKVMRRAKVVLAPSMFEGFGMVPAEALASGTPVVAFDLPVLRQEYGAHPGLYLIKRGDREAFKRRVAELAEQPKVTVDVRPIIANMGLDSMTARLETTPHLTVARRSVAACMIAYWGFCPESIESVYPYVDEVRVAFGRVNKARKFGDGSLERLRAVPDPDGKITIETRDVWTDKREMREWCSGGATGNYLLLLDGDEVWAGAERWIADAPAFGAPRWVNLWHNAKHWIRDADGAPARWGRRLQPHGSACRLYRWSWWRESYRWLKHHTPEDRSGNLLLVDNAESAAVVPECTIYHLGHALRRGVMDAKHALYIERDGGKATEQRRDAWKKWDGKPGDCGDGIVEAVNWELPEIVRRAIKGAGE